MEKERTECVRLDDKIAELIEIRRYGEVEGGFQRKLNTEVLSKIIKSARKEECIPPILLAKIDGRYRLLDGQHRFEAWKQEKFELWAQITPMRPPKAVETFCTVNGTARKLQLGHQLAVDPSGYAKKLREVAASFEYEIEPRIIHATLQEFTGQNKGRTLVIEDKTWEFIRDMFKVWKNDKRWGTKGSIYSSYGTFIMLSHVMKHSKNPVETLEKLKKLDYSKEGSLGIRYGGSTSAARKMAKFAMTSLMRRGLV